MRTPRIWAFMDKDLGGRGKVSEPGNRHGEEKQGSFWKSLPSALREAGGICAICRARSSAVQPEVSPPSQNVSVLGTGPGFLSAGPVDVPCSLHQWENKSK